MTKRNVFEKHPSGTAAVEFAVVLPLFFLLVMGSIELGRALLVRHSLEEAARSGCRVAVARGGTTDDARNLVDQAMCNTSITGYTVTVNPDPPTQVAAGSPVTVSVTVPYKNVGWVPVPSFMGGKTIIGRCVMPAEGASAADDSGSSGSSGSTSPTSKKKGKSKSKGKTSSKSKSKSKSSSKSKKK